MSYLPLGLFSALAASSNQAVNTDLREKPRRPVTSTLGKNENPCLSLRFYNPTIHPMTLVMLEITRANYYSGISAVG